MGRTHPWQRSCALRAGRRWAEKLQPKRDEKGKVNPILGVVEPAIEQELLGRLLGMNLGMAGEG